MADLLSDAQAFQQRVDDVDEWLRTIGHSNVADLLRDLLAEHARLRAALAVAVRRAGDAGVAESPSLTDADIFRPGEQVFYLLQRAPSNGRPQDLFLRVVVLKDGGQWVSVREVGRVKGARILKRKNLMRHTPEGAWIR